MYARMIIMMLISLYTARIVLSTLGFDDYGVYQVVGGVIVLFSFLNNGLSAASNRFITAEIAKGDFESGKRVFNVCFQSHLLIALIILILAESIGLWVVNTILNIPESRIFAANVVYQLSVISSIIGIINSPFNTTLIAYERMNIFAYLAVFDAMMKLLIVYLIQVI
ncbi:MAG: polysaccharide biosynthesis protein, partial [Bacteroidales bacterium]|nr:polysaccharide biosynthesis protein [Bacteroidales bacterium]